MTPQQARIALGCFLLLAAGVAANALFMQTRPTLASRAVLERPLPRSTADRMRNSAEVAPATRPAQRKVAEDRTQRTAHLAPDSAMLDDLPAASETADENSETIRAIQRELRQREYGALVSDGVMRPVTRAAIMAYEHDQGLPLTGEASEALLKRLLLGVSLTADAPAATARKVATVRAAQIVRKVQELLAKLGYQPGQADGRLGEDTLRAVREFELDKGLAAKGRISAEVLMRLTDAAAQAGKPASTR